MGMGISVGKTMSVGASMKSTAWTRQSEACLIGVELVGFAKGIKMVTILCFAPFSGRCFLRHPGNFLMSAIVMPPAEGDVVHTWFEVTSDGGVRFLRDTGDVVHMSGTIPRSQLPPWSRDYFASMCFQVDQLSSQVEACIEWSAVDLPTVPRRESSLECEAEWNLDESE